MKNAACSVSMIPPGKTNMVSAVYSALYALQHRGQESCGIALNVDGVLTGYRDLGPGQRGIYPARAG